MPEPDPQARTPLGLVRSVLHRDAHTQPVPGGFGAQEPADLRRLDHPVGIALAALALIVSVTTSILGAPTVSIVSAWATAGAALIALSLRPPTSSRVALVAMAALVIGWRADPLVGAAAMVGLTMVALMLTPHRHVLVIATASVLAAVAPVVWLGRDGVLPGLGLGLVTCLTAYFASSVEIETIYLARTSRALMENAPIAIMDQDWSGVIVELEKLRRAGIDDLGSYLRSNPDELTRLVACTRVFSANAEAAKIVPAPASDGKQGEPVIRRLGFEANVEAMCELYEGKLAQRRVIPFLDEDGAVRWARFVGIEHPNGNGRVIITAMDVTALQETQAALERLHDSKDRFVASISHELRTPLAAVVGFTSELLERPDSLTPAERNEALQLANEQAMEAANIIADLLVVARADIGGVQVNHDSIDIEAEIDRVLSAHGASISLKVLNDPPAICADANRTHQVLRNLITNSNRYGGPNRRILVMAADEVVSVEVRDDGDDTATEQLERLFEPYARGHRAIGITESVGLGLTVSRQLAEAMGGSLRAFRDGDETVFRLELPVWGRCPVTRKSHAESGADVGP